MVKLDAHYDAVVIGCGMSGLAAAIRLALFDQRVLLVERHNAPGGLNSFYSHDGRKFDVGLHAVTNYATRQHRQAPLNRIFRQLRIPREAFALKPQGHSRIAFPEAELTFSNDPERLQESIAVRFPGEIDRFRRLRARIASEYQPLTADPALTAREVLGEMIGDPLLREMLLCPPLCYGSARPHDLDWDLYVLLFQAIFAEGFGRPRDGIRVILRALLNKFRELGGVRQMKCGVRALHLRQDGVDTIELEDGRTVTADRVFSSIGHLETLALCQPSPAPPPPLAPGTISFIETITVLDQPPCTFGWDETVLFYSVHPTFAYAAPPPDALVNPDVGVFCSPNNYAYGDEPDLEEGIVRITALGSYDGWAALDEETYQSRKAAWYEQLWEAAGQYLPGATGPDAPWRHAVYRDVFTPRTVRKYTGHVAGSVYGAAHKQRDGRTPVRNLFLLGTDTGLLGITGAMLSGITMANQYGLPRTAAGS